ncbi:Uu.00g061580.m01.CDS01 [Anthostomella pinea]|uniref:Uu.00g061580.m01.CDS01 n=1 Tax=Anthostomella pinea TaxID=933095 RepID=A0AAI8VTA6_9PEZI|nr:Uu.00g061580.m01.CDS01 [Anthostomella pinea]
MTPSTFIFSLLGIFLSSAVAVPAPLTRGPTDPPPALPQCATQYDLRWQPAMDFDTDSCYNTPAIGIDGSVAVGLPVMNKNPDGCHDISDLDNNNVYVRQRCNNGYCAYIYDYYFQKDSAGDIFHQGHRHDWEHIVVWVKDDQATHVAVSQHEGFEVREAKDLRWDGDHPKVIYHRNGGSTHCFRFAREDDDRIENAKGVWFYGALVDYMGSPGHLRETLMTWDFAKIAINDQRLEDALQRASPQGITFDCGWDNDNLNYEVPLQGC